MRAALYTRVSTRDQEEEGTSLVSQEARCRAYAFEQHYAVDESNVYRETHTGAQLWERPALSRMREAIRQGNLDVVVAYAIDRLSRNTAHLTVLIEEAEHAGTRVEFVTESLDHSPEGKLIRDIRGYAAQVEHEKIRERTIRGKLERVRAGRLLPGGKPLYGYRWIDVEDERGNVVKKAGLEVDPMTAPVVRRIFADCVNGKSLRRIATDLTLEAIPAPRGKAEWQPNSVAKILHHPNYTGRARAWWYRPVGETKALGFDLERAVELPDGVVPQLVDEGTWHVVQERLRRNKEQAARNNKEPSKTLLRAGFGRCGLCGGILSAERRAGDRHIYRCSKGKLAGMHCTHNISARILDAAVWERVESILTRPAIVAQELERLRRDDPTETDLAAIDRAVAEAGRRETNLAQAISMLTDPDAIAPLARQLQLLADQKRQFLGEREAVLRRRDAWAAAEDQVSSISAWCETVATRLEELTYEDKRLALEALEVQVKLYPSSCDERWVITASIPLAPTIASTTSRDSAVPRSPCSSPRPARPSPRGPAPRRTLH